MGSRIRCGRPARLLDRWLELTAPEELILAPGSTSALTVERVYLVASLT